MPAGSIRNWKVVLACLLLTCSLVVVSTAAVEHGHEGAASHSCDVCHFGHMASIAPLALAGILPELVAEWHCVSETSQSPQDCRISISSCRAPPAGSILRSA